MRDKKLKDRADLTTTIIIIASLAITSILAIGSIAFATRDNAKKLPIV